MITDRKNLCHVTDKIRLIAAGALVATVVIGTSSWMEPSTVLAKETEGAKVTANAIADVATDLLKAPSKNININSAGDYESYFGVEVMPHEDLENRTLSGAAGFEIETEMKEYWKDGELHEAITEKSAAELAQFVCDRRDDEGNLCFPDITPSLLMAQQSCESSFVLDATSGKNGKGSQVGLAQISCKFTIDEVNKWAYIVGEDEIQTKEEARELLLSYPALSAVVQAEILQKYMDSCPATYEDKEAYALDAYRWGANDVANHDSSYSSHVREVQELYEDYFEESTREDEGFDR